MHRRFLTFVVTAGALALGTGVTTAHASTAIGTDTVYVSTHGSDANPCTKSQPCATLQFAVDNAPAGSIVHVAAGTYNQTVNITQPVTIAGAGAGKTIIDGSNIDTQAMSPSYFGVISVEDNIGAGGPINIRGLTVKNAFITTAEYDEDSDPSDVIVYNDANAGDTVNVTGVALGAVQNASEFTGVGLDTFDDAASVTFTNSSVTGVFQGALLEGGGLGGHVTVNNVSFNHLAACAAATVCGGGTTFPAEGLFVLSDQPGTANDTINNNRFVGYAGFGIAADAGYSGGNCTAPNGPCTGNVNLIANTNMFTLGACAASDGCAAIYLDAQSGNELSAHLQGDKGTVHSPDEGIFENPDSGLYSVTEVNDHIKVV
jgi:hypothetical protein